jgi:hypothetical protein
MSNYGMYRGDSLILNILVQQLQDPTLPAGSTNPLVPVDLTGSTIWMTAKKELADLDASAVFQIKTPTDIVVDADPTSGRAKIIVPASSTTSLTFPTDVAQIELFYDVQVKTSTGIVQTVASGKITLTEDVTDAVT